MYSKTKMKQKSPKLNLQAITFQKVNEYPAPPSFPEGNTWPQLPHKRMFMFYVIAASLVLEMEKLRICFAADSP